MSADDIRRTIDAFVDAARRAFVELRAQVIRSQLILFWTHYSWLQALALTLLSIGAGLLNLARSIIRAHEPRERRISYARTGLLIFRYCLETSVQRRPQIAYP